MNIKKITFGQRIGLEPREIPFQINEIDKTFRVEIWNALYIYIFEVIEESKYDLSEISRISWMYFFKQPLDEFPDKFDFKRFVKNFILETVWYKVYEYLEYILDNIPEFDDFNNEEFVEYLEDTLQLCSSGYTIIDNKFVPVINEIEINEIKNTQSLSKKFDLVGVQLHLNKSLEMISQKPIPDFRNSIKESISMVEAIIRQIEPENTLGKALNKLDKKNKINKTIKSAFEKLYAYTNDKNGIRHALLDDENISSEDAKFFLISCSAFSNYLIEKAVKEKII